METMINKIYGPVALVDALGVSMQDEALIRKFLLNRDSVLDDTHFKVLHVRFSGSVETITFGDTILISVESMNSKDLENDCDALMRVLRRLLVYSLDNEIFFRGAFSIGEQYRNTRRNTILGPAIDDVAAWYEKADWIGIHATPHATMQLHKWNWQRNDKFKFVAFDYDVPLKTGPMKLMSVNWPKAYFVNGVSPIKPLTNVRSDKPRSHVLEKLTSRPIPAGVEKKHFNTMKFFDHIHPQNINEEIRARNARAKKATIEKNRLSKKQAGISRPRPA